MGAERPTRRYPGDLPGSLGRALVRMFAGCIREAPSIELLGYGSASQRQSLRRHSVYPRSTQWWAESADGKAGPFGRLESTKSNVETVRNSRSVSVSLRTPSSDAMRCFWKA